MSAMPNADYMRMLSDFQAQGGVVGQNATKKLQEAQAIINANQGGNGGNATQQITAAQKAINQPAYVAGGSSGFYNNQAAQTTQYPSGTGQNPFSFTQGTTTYSDYDPTTNTIKKSMGGIAGNINGGRLNVADLINSDNVFQGGGVQNLNNSYYNEEFANAFNQYQNQASQTTQYPSGTGQNTFSGAGQAITLGPDGQYYTNTSMTTPFGNTGFDTTLPILPQNPATSPVTGGLTGITNWSSSVGNTGFDTTLPILPQNPATVTGGLTGMPSAPSSVGAGEVALGGLLGGLLGGGIDLQNVLGTAGQVYLGQEAISAPYEVGRAGLEMAEQVGQRGAETAAFRPYTVTSNLARVGTDPSGGFTTQLSPEQQALQNQIIGQAGGFFSQLQADPAAVQAGIYEDIRATQRPEEERQRLALEERMLSQGRLGLSSAAYGGASPELLAMETVRQEAMARANVGARQQALTEQAQTAALAGGLLGAGYMPQQQALSLLEASQIPAGFADIGRRSGAQFQQQAGLAGIESLLQGSSVAEANRLAQLQNLATTLTGRQDPLTGSFGGGLLSSILGGGESIQDMLTFPTTATDSFLGGSDFLSSIFLPEVTNPYDTGSLFSGYVPPAIPSAGQSIDLNSILTNIENPYNKDTGVAGSMFDFNDYTSSAIPSAGQRITF